MDDPEFTSAPLKTSREQELESWPEPDFEPHANPVVGRGCPKCGSQAITQKKRITNTGRALAVAGLIFAFCSYGGTLTLSVIGFCLRERRGTCSNCHWQWRC